jgi:hypothetical protein
MTYNINIESLSVWYRDKEGKPLTVLEWGDLFEDINYRFIATDMIGTTQVSTIWLGLLDMWGRYFETCVFNEKREILEMIRYESLEEALLGHKAEVYRVKKEQNAI